MKNVLLLIFTIVLWPIRAQTVRQPLLSLYTGFGAYNKNAVDAFSFLVNTAALAGLKQSSAGVYSERRFLLSTFNQHTAVAGLLTNSGVFGLHTSYFGNTSYAETQIGLGYGRSLGNKIDVGVKFNYYTLRIPAYLFTSAIHFEAGVLMHLSETLQAGFSVFNPVGGQLLQNKNEKIASVFRGGIGCEVSEDFFISAEIVKEENKPTGVNSALQYELLKQLILRAGINTIQSQPFIGVGLRFGLFRIDVVTAYHQQLGISPALMILFNSKHKSEK